MSRENEGKERLLSDLGLRLGPSFGGERRNYVENCLRLCLDVDFNGISFLVKIYLNYYIKSYYFACILSINATYRV